MPNVCKSNSNSNFKIEVRKFELRFTSLVLVPSRPSALVVYDAGLSAAFRAVVDRWLLVLPVKEALEIADLIMANEAAHDFQFMFSSNHSPIFLCYGDIDNVIFSRSVPFWSANEHCLL